MIYSTVQVSYSAVCRLWTAKSQYGRLISVYQSAGAPEFEKQLGEVHTMVIFFFFGGGGLKYAEVLLNMASISNRKFEF